MTNAIVWNDAKDDTICTMRSKGASWREIGDVLGVSGDSVLIRARVLGVWSPQLPQKKKNKVHPTPTREAYPPGHPVTWGAITAGTILAGVPYPIEPKLSRETVEERDEWEANMAEWRMAA